MNQEKIGKFIRELRKEKGMSQTNLAEKLYLSRNAVSRWENGHNLPDSSTFTLLAEIFDVSTDELLLGKRIDKKERQNKVSELTLTMVDDRHKQNKIIRRLIITLITLLLTFLGYYFINSYNSIKVYIMSGKSENFSTKDGIFVVTNDNMYFRLGNLEFNKEIEIDRVELFYKKEEKEILVSSSNNYDILLRDYNGYDTYFKSNDMKHIMNNLYLRIYYNNISEDMKINLEKDFSNNSLIFFNKKNSTSGSDAEFEKKNDDNKTIPIPINKMICENEICTLEINNGENNISFLYLQEENVLSVLNLQKDRTFEWTYLIDAEILEYKVYENEDEKINASIYLNRDNNYTKEENEFIKDFKENYVLNYLY